MAVTHVQSAGGLADGTYTVSSNSITVSAGNLIVAAVAKWNGGDISDPFVLGDISKSGTAVLGTWTLDKADEIGTVDNSVGIYSAPVTTGGTLSVSVTSSGGNAYLVLGVAEFSGADVTGTRVAGSNSGSGTSTSPSSGTVASGGGGVYVGALAISSADANTITPTNSFSTIYESEDGTAHMTGGAAYRIVTTSETLAATWTIDSDPWLAAVVCYKAAASEGGSASPSASPSISPSSSPSVSASLSPSISPSSSISASASPSSSPSSSPSVSTSGSPSASPSVSPSKSPSVSSSASASPSPSPSIAPEDAICWGDAGPHAGEESVTWRRWMVDATTVAPITGDPDWGDASFDAGSPIVSPVTDTGDTGSKTFTITANKYGTGSGAQAIYIRGQATSFGMFDPSPSWEAYSAPTPQTWRYVQVKLAQS